MATWARGAIMAKGKRANGTKSPRAENFLHPEADSQMRPDIGAQPRFKKRKPPRTYRYDSSLAPALDWDGQNPAREQGEAILAGPGRRTLQCSQILNQLCV